MTKRQLNDVFKTVGLPEYTYVKPSYFGEIRSDISMPGKHVLIEGPSGIGKSCVVFKVFEELNWKENVKYKLVSGRDPSSEAAIDEFISKAENGEEPEIEVLVVDDFHILGEEFRIKTGSKLKKISDKAFLQKFPLKFILIGIPTAGASLLVGSGDLGPRLGTYRLSRADDSDIQKLISEGEEELNIIFEDSDVILSESTGNFWTAQFICNKICSFNDIYEEQDSVSIISSDLLSVRKRLMDELSLRFMPTAKTFARGKKWRPGGNKPYLEILLSICKIPDLVIPFDTILSVVSDRRRPGIKAVRSRIREVLFDPSTGVDLRRQIAFEDSGFSIEDPLFRYFLSYMSRDALFRDLGVLSDSVERSSLYAYDIGFSFSGETRRIVELVNSSLKEEDIVTFYDFDQQAILLSEDLGPTLKKIYSESCRYYLVFIEEKYLEKVWTRYEKDILTNSGRSKHIIPVYLVKDKNIPVVGISSQIGRIDISDVWASLNSTGKIDISMISTIRNRIVLPLIDKIDDSFQGV